MLTEFGLVPYVALWSSEVEGLEATPMSTDLLFNKDCPRDPMGVYWIPFPSSPGVGTPQFGHVHTHRQVECMRRPMCQVCGKKLDRRRCHWILNKLDAENLEDGKPFRTQTPPVCKACIKTSFAQCPHLQSLGHSVKVLEVTSYSCIGVIGDAILQDRSLRKFVFLTYGNPQMWRLIGRQLVVELTKWRIYAPKT